MKKLLVVLLAWFLLGQLSLEKWQSIQEPEAFLQAIAEMFSQQNKCDSEVVALTDGTEVAIFGKCAERKVEL